MLMNSVDELENEFNFDLIDENTALLGFITEYLEKRGLTSTLQALQAEKSVKILKKSQVSSLIDSVNEIRDTRTEGDSESVLFEWWKVFWNILKEKKRTFKDPVQKNINNNTTSAMNNPVKKLKRIATEDSSSYTKNPLNPLKSSGEETLKGNKVTGESWRMYLNLCKEYQKGVSSAVNHVTVNSMNTANIPQNTIPNTTLNSQYLGVIDQVNQPIDSRQLLLLRQSLYQEYIKKQQCANMNTNVSGGVNNILMTNTTSTANTQTHNTINIHTHTTSPIINTPPMTESFFNADQEGEDADRFGKDELNFNDFMNEYLI